MSYAGYFFGRAHTEYDQLALRGASDSVDDRRTPQHVFAPLHAEFAFTLDAAASPDNALCPVYFGLARDGLSESWAGERVWCNPPYSDLAPWVRKAWLETDKCGVIVMLLPANRAEQGWWSSRSAIVEAGCVRGFCGVVLTSTGRTARVRAEALPSGACFSFGARP